MGHLIGPSGANIKAGLLLIPEDSVGEWFMLKGHGGRNGFWKVYVLQFFEEIHSRHGFALFAQFQ